VAACPAPLLFHGRGGGAVAGEVFGASHVTHSPESAAEGTARHSAIVWEEVIALGLAAASALFPLVAIAVGRAYIPQLRSTGRMDRMTAETREEAATRQRVAMDNRRSNPFPMLRVLLALMAVNSAKQLLQWDWDALVRVTVHESVLPLLMQAHWSTHTLTHLVLRVAVWAGVHWSALAGCAATAVVLHVLFRRLRVADGLWWLYVACEHCAIMTMVVFGLPQFALVALVRMLAVAVWRYSDDLIQYARELHALSPLQVGLQCAVCDPTPPPSLAFPPTPSPRFRACRRSCAPVSRRCTGARPMWTGTSGRTTTRMWRGLALRWRGSRAPCRVDRHLRLRHRQCPRPWSWRPAAARLHPMTPAPVASCVQKPPRPIPTPLSWRI
jgi:hypothetical protein